MNLTKFYLGLYEINLKIAGQNNKLFVKSQTDSQNVISLKKCKLFKKHYLIEKSSFFSYTFLYGL